MHSFDLISNVVLWYSRNNYWCIPILGCALKPATFSIAYTVWEKSAKIWWCVVKVLKYSYSPLYLHSVGWGLILIDDPGQKLPSVGYCLMLVFGVAHRISASGFFISDRFWVWSHFLCFIVVSKFPCGDTLYTIGSLYASYCLCFINSRFLAED